jgi:uncharacterized protein with PQ loop repeat
MELIGWIGSALLALCGVPLAWQTIKQKHARYMSNTFLAMWLIGEILNFAYILPKRDYPLLLNYSLNIVFLMIVVMY